MALDTNSAKHYVFPWIKSYGDKDTQTVADRHRVPKFSAGIQRRVQQKLMILNNARDLNDLRVPPGNRLEALAGDRKGQYSIRVNDQWRLCFVWRNGDAYQVELVDYH